MSPEMCEGLVSEHPSAVNQLKLSKAFNLSLTLNVPIPDKVKKLS